jgi:hypothetical protein
MLVYDHNKWVICYKQNILILDFLLQIVIFFQFRLFAFVLLICVKDNLQTVWGVNLGLNLMCRRLGRFMACVMQFV